MKLHPNVKVIVNLKPAQGYADYISAGFAAGTPVVAISDRERKTSI